MSMQEARARGLIWWRRKGALTRLGLPEPEWNETNQDVVAKGAKAVPTMMHAGHVVTTDFVSKDV